MTDPLFDVVQNDAERQFEIRDGDLVARLTYLRREGEIQLIHTEVPAALEGRGFGSRLALAALTFAEAKSLRVVPTCPFVRAYIRRHPEYSKLTWRGDK